MDKEGFSKKLRSIVGAVVKDVSEKDGQVEVYFSDETVLTANYWRLIGDSLRITSFDQGQKYGLPKEIDAVKKLSEQIFSQKIMNVLFREDSGDLEFAFEKTKLCIFNFTSYEIWEIRFSDGTGQYSNYV